MRQRKLIVKEDSDQTESDDNNLFRLARSKMPKTYIEFMQRYVKKAKDLIVTPDLSIINHILDLVAKLCVEKKIFKALKDNSNSTMDTSKNIHNWLHGKL